MILQTIFLPAYICLGYISGNLLWEFFKSKNYKKAIITSMFQSVVFLVLYIYF